ncbi:type I-C CRISPR-associated protein Cas8c/Csd1 [Candidatus Arthromitus sp. SFB-rat-Yit]|uniref:type I-C CRISPR-associated protein Cas8c/Csd1 n=1 Tax=Candidatus Arthromitus sp. SFB-rat-Yit TaxID=1041504 RepID=UPI000227A75B|nr:type I-C CRISPR-associated protein Cas8c/Csd1 [Candidatus Arthromitus sp. SFB-rat-Yit]BAK81139.1 CRISPR-associated protein, Csd1 family [Candidatus Arthromitus sp. SFB-rat-Yit]
MILKELVDCYDLMANSDKFQIADNNSNNENVSFKVTIDQDGIVSSVIDLREGSGSKRKPVLMTVPYKFSGRTGKSIVPYFLYDNAKYLFGCELDSKSLELNRFDEYVGASKKLHMEILEGSQSKYQLILEKFFDNRDQNIEIVKEKDTEALKSGFIVLCFKNDTKCIHEQQEIKKAFALYRQIKFKDVKDLKGDCLISGFTNVPIARTHTPIKGVLGSSASGAMIVSFNESAFESYGKKQSYNASVSNGNEFKYTTVLNKILSGNENKIYLSGNSIVFWSNKIGCKEEKIIHAFLRDDEDDNDEEGNGGIKYNQEGVDKIESVIKLIKQGKTVNIDKLKLDDSVNMYILGLYGTKSRIFIRFWFKNSLIDFVKLTNKHFEDTKLKRIRKINKKDLIHEEVGVKMSLILKTITPYGKSQNTPKALINTLFKSILTGVVYPISIYNKILERIKAEAGEDYAVNHTRVSFIKGYLKRYYRLNNFKDKEEEITVSLNKESKNVAYNLGRIFAILEKIQMDSNNGSTNIREKYLSSASSTPKSIFPNLLNLAQYHIAKINKENNRMFNYYDKIIGEILLNINEFPAVFSSDEQGMFILGYYHQREDIYTPKKDKEEN